MEGGGGQQMGDRKGKFLVIIMQIYSQPSPPPTPMHV